VWNRPRVLIAAPASGSGKTMITCGLLQALTLRSLRVASFKCGPDYIDPMFHEKVIGTRSGNLDLFFADPPLLQRLFCRNSAEADISVIEGVMGYYDGMLAAGDDASSYSVARTLQCPTVLIVNARGQSVSALATLEGFVRFRQDSGVRGVIFNQMPERIFKALKPQIEAMGVKALGYVPKAEDMVIESRHLGLVTPDEIRDLSEKLRRLAALLEQTVDIDALIALAQSAPALTAPPEPEYPALAPTTIAVARDEAFCFLYRDNLSLLERLGAQLRFFSPIHDSALPAGAQGLILCGGYPELYAKTLSENVPMRTAIRDAIAGGMPTLAECGGFMYLHEEMEDMEGALWPMVGVIPGKVWRTKKLGRFGYVTLTANAPTAFLPEGERVQAHEFHYYESESCGDALTATKPDGARKWQCEHADGALLAGFPHLFYESDPDLIVRFLKKCAERS
jgi:cobyrinic acid a,c-diamide synthase